MKEKLKDIIPNEGLGLIKFGISNKDVQDIIGDPTEKEMVVIEDDSQQKNEVWHYDELEISLEFEDDEGWQLVNIAISSPIYEFHGERLIGLSREGLLQKLDQIGITEFLLEEMVFEDENQILIRSNETGLNFFLDDGNLSEIMMSQIENIEENHLYPN